MRKFFSLAGMMFVAAFLFVQPSKADNFNTYQLTGNGWNVTFTLPQTLTPSSVEWNGVLNIQNVSGTFNGGAYNFARIQLGLADWSNFTNYWAFGSQTKSFELVAPGLFTWNADGTVTLSTGTFALGDYNSFSGGPRLYTLTIVDPPSDSTVPTPEPASLILLGAGSLALGALRRRKTN